MCIMCITPIIRGTACDWPCTRAVSEASMDSQQPCVLATVQVPGMGTRAQRPLSYSTMYKQPCIVVAQRAYLPKTAVDREYGCTIASRLSRFHSTPQSTVQIGITQPENCQCGELADLLQLPENNLLQGRCSSQKSIEKQHTCQS